MDPEGGGGVGETQHQYNMRKRKVSGQTSFEVGKLGVTTNSSSVIYQGGGVVSSAEFRRKRIFTVLLLYLTYGCYYLPRKADSIVKVSLQKDANFSVEQLALGDTSYLFVYTFALFGSGVLGARVPSNIMLSCGLLGVAFTSYLKGSTTSPILYAGAQGLHAIFQSTGWPTCIKLLAVWITHNRGSLMGVWTTCQSLGGVLGAVFATYMVSNFYWSMAYFAHIPILIFVALLNFLYIADELPFILGPGGVPQIPEREDDSQNNNKDANNSTTPSEENTPTLAKILALPGVISVGTAYFFLKFLRYALLFWLPYYYKEGLGYDKSVAGYISTSFEFGGLVGTPLIGFVSDKYMNRRRDLAGAIFMTFAGFMLALCIKFSDGGVVLNAFLMSLVGVGVIGPDSVLSGTIAQDIGNRSGLGKSAVGQIAGLVNSVGSFGSIFQSSATAYISQEFGWPVLFMVFVVSSFVSAGILFRFAFSAKKQ